MARRSSLSLGALPLLSSSRAARRWRRPAAAGAAQQPAWVRRLTAGAARRPAWVRRLTAGAVRRYPPSPPHPYLPFSSSMRKVAVVVEDDWISPSPSLPGDLPPPARSWVAAAGAEVSAVRRRHRGGHG
ncbi:hypothetical protein OsI_38106 [Oryza sativa Indica Group]|uniref:Uncharacterized protein n=1 Tax=Oryza sativa subsp. indica TaxID=39946 RepID=A2ZJW0_ORYSI|nr:hypothetical protein OsI_38106 [Oryza sativa Indica Group]